MVRRTARAALQIDALLSHYYQAERFEAADRLVEAIDRALALIGREPGSGLAYPRPYPEIAQRGFLWIRVHRYWFGHKMIDGVAVLTNVLFDAADLPSRVQDVDRVLPTHGDEKE